MPADRPARLAVFVLAVAVFAMTAACVEESTATSRSANTRVDGNRMQNAPSEGRGGSNMPGKGRGGEHKLSRFR